MSRQFRCGTTAARP